MRPGWSRCASVRRQYENFILCLMVQGFCRMDAIPQIGLTKESSKVRWYPPSDQILRTTGVPLSGYLVRYHPYHQYLVPLERRDNWLLTLPVGRSGSSQLSLFGSTIQGRSVNWWFIFPAKMGGKWREGKGRGKIDRIFIVDLRDPWMNRCQPREGRFPSRRSGWISMTHYHLRLSLVPKDDEGTEPVEQSTLG